MTKEIAFFIMDNVTMNNVETGSERKSLGLEKLSFGVYQERLLEAKKDGK